MQHEAHITMKERLRRAAAVEAEPLVLGDQTAEEAEAARRARARAVLGLPSPLTIEAVNDFVDAVADSLRFKW